MNRGATRLFPILLTLLISLTYVTLTLTSGRARFTPTGLELTQLTVALGLGMYLLFRHGKTFIKTPSRLHIFTYICATYFIIRALLSPVFFFGIQEATLVLTATIFYTLGSQFSPLNKAERALKLTLFILLLLHITTLIIQQFFTPQFLLGYPNEASERSGLFVYHNITGHFCGLCTIFSLFKAIWGKGQHHRWTWVLITILSLLALGLSNSRGAIVALIPALLTGITLSTLGIYRSAENKIVSRTFGLLTLTLILVTTAGGLLYYVIQTRAGGNWDAFFNSNGRDIISYYAHQLLTHPTWCGMGSQSFTYEVYPVLDSSRFYSPYVINYAHNEFLQLRLDYGRIGLILVLIWGGSHFLRIIWGLIKLPKKLSYEVYPDSIANVRGNLIAGGAVLIYAYVHACMDFPWHIMPLLTFLGYSTGLTTSAIPTYTTLGKYTPTYHKFLLIFTPVITLLCGIISYKFLPNYPDQYTTQQFETTPPQTPQEKENYLKSLQQLCQNLPHEEILTQYGLAQLALLPPTQPHKQQAIKSFQQALHYNPKAPIPKLNLAYTLGELGEFDTSEKTFHELIQWAGLAFGPVPAREYYVNMLYLKAYHYQQKGDDVRAYTTLLRAQKEYETFPMQSPANIQQIRQQIKLYQKTKTPLDFDIYTQPLY